MKHSHILWTSVVVQAVVIAVLVISPTLLGILLCLLAFPLMIAAVVRWPLAGIYLIIFSIFLGALSTIQFGQKMPNLFYADIAILAVLYILIIKQLMNPINGLRLFVGRTGLILMLFLVFSFCTLTISEDLLRGLGVLRNYLVGFTMLVLMSSLVRTQKQIRGVAHALALWGSLLAVIAITSVFFRPQLSLFERVSLGWGRANYIAVFPVMMVPVVLAPVLSRSEAKWRFCLMVAASLLIITLLFTLSRGGAVALLVVLTILTAKYIKARSLRYLILFLAIVFVLVYFSPLGRMLVYRFETISTSPSALVRIARWKGTWEVFKKNPVVGVGIGNLAHHLSRVTEHAKAHNLVLMLLSETGLVGFSIFMWMIVWIVRMQIMNCRQIRDGFQNSLSWGILAATIGVLVHSMVEPIFEAYQFSLIFWGLVGISTKQYLWRKET